VPDSSPKPRSSWFVAFYARVASETHTTSNNSETLRQIILKATALFDLALLIVMAEQPFYHFVYHDGILEGLDTRKRKVLLDLLREVAAKYKIQYIMSAIDSDLPRDEKDKRIEFPSKEIVLPLSDQGTKGRLFRMDEF